MAIEMRYGILCDYATMGANGKPIAIHIFDHFRVAAETDIVLPHFTLLARFECSLADGGSHVIDGEIVDEDFVRVAAWSFPDQTFVTQGPGLPLIRSVTLNVSGLRVGRVGAYEMIFRCRSTIVGRVHFRVLTAPDPGQR